MAVLLEERQEPLPDLGSLHRRWSLGQAAQDLLLAHRVAPQRSSRPVQARRTDPFFAAISVQFLAEAAGLLQVSTAKVCIACAGTRVALIYADDAE